MTEAGAEGAIGIREFDAIQRRELRVRTVAAPVGSGVTVGREAELRQAVAPLDTRISRLSQLVGSSQDGVSALCCNGCR